MEYGEALAMEQAITSLVPVQIQVQTFHELLTWRKKNLAHVSHNCLYAFFCRIGKQFLPF